MSHIIEENQHFSYHWIIYKIKIIKWQAIIDTNDTPLHDKETLSLGDVVLKLAEVFQDSDQKHGKVSCLVSFTEIKVFHQAKVFDLKWDSIA